MFLMLMSLYFKEYLIKDVFSYSNLEEDYEFQMGRIK